MSEINNTAKLPLTAECHHCGLPVLHEGDSFCCSGCEFVYRTIHKLGLEEFYRYRGLSQLDVPKPAAPKGESFSYLDDDEFVAALSKDGAGVAAASLLVDGVHCAGCVWLLEKLPSVLPGLISSTLNFSTAKLAVRFDPQRIKLSQIARTLDSLGYPPVPETQGAQASAQRREERRMLVRIGIAGFCAANTMMIAVSLWQGFFTGIESKYAEFFRWMSFLLTLPAVTYSAYPFYRTAWQALRMHTFHIDLPIAIGVIGGFFFSALNTVLGREYVYYDSITALTFLLLVGRFLQARATARAREESSRGWDFLPAVARVVADQETREVPVQFVRKGDLVEVRPSERIPVDGEVTRGSSSLDLSVLTGESAPQPIAAGAKVFAGTLNLESPLVLRVEASGEHSRVGKIKGQIETLGQRAEILTLTNRVSGYFVVIVLLLAIATFGYWWYAESVYVAIDNAVALLIVTCPCALGLATPVALSVALGRAARSGILIRGSDTVERLSRLKRLYFDKTGTLTEAKQRVVFEHFDAERVRLLPTLRALLQIAPHHPASRALGQHLDGPVSVLALSEPLHVGGRGVSAQSNEGMVWRLGSLAWMRECGVVLSAAQEALLADWLTQGLTPLLLCEAGDARALFALMDTPRVEAQAVLKELAAEGYEQYLLSGDVAEVAQAVAAKVGIPAGHVHAQAYPETKREIMARDGSLAAMVGDGVNDAAAMRAAYVGIGLRGGIEALLDVVDVFIARGELVGVSRALHGAKATMRVIRRNLAFSVCYNILSALGAVLGYINPLVAGVIMPLSSLTVILHSISARTFNEE